MSAIITILIFYFTLQENRKQIYEERKLYEENKKKERIESIKPVFTSLLEYRMKNDKYFDPDKNVYFLFFNLKNLSIFEFTQRSIFKTSTSIINDIYFTNNENNILFEYELKNISNNIAYNTTLTINNEKQIKLPRNIEGQKSIILRIMINCDNIDINKNNMINFKISFYDINNEAHYIQEENFTIQKNILGRIKKYVINQESTEGLSEIRNISM